MWPLQGAKAKLEAREHQGRTLRYLTVEPDGFEPGRGYPLVILLHGYGAHMGDLAALCPAVDSQRYIYAFPNGPVRLRLGYGSEGYAWSASVDGGADETLEPSAEKLLVFSDEVVEQYEVEEGGVVLGGFSQGGMMTYRCGLPDPGTFSGVAALSSRIPEPDRLETLLPEGRSQPIFITHGTADPLLPVEDGRRARHFLEDHGYSPDYREYEMGHQITDAVVRDLAVWIGNVLAPQGAKTEGRL